MLVKILKPFPYAADGVRIRDLAAGDVEEIHDDLIPGLEGEGWVKRVKAAAAGAAGPSTESGAGEGTEGGTGGSTEAGSGEGAEPGSGDATESGSGQSIESGAVASTDSVSTGGGPAPVADQFDAMTDKALRAFIKDRDGAGPSNFVKRPDLLALARKAA